VTFHVIHHVERCFGHVRTSLAIMTSLSVATFRDILGKFQILHFDFII
jgi:hypothetical protein